MLSVLNNGSVNLLVYYNNKKRICISVSIPDHTHFNEIGYKCKISYKDTLILFYEYSENTFFRNQFKFF